MRVGGRGLLVDVTWGSLRTAKLMKVGTSRFLSETANIICIRSSSEAVLDVDWIKNHELSAHGLWLWRSLTKYTVQCH